MTHVWRYEATYLPRVYGRQSEPQRFEVPTWRLSLGHTTPRLLSDASVIQTCDNKWAARLDAPINPQVAVFDDLEEAKTFALALAILNQ